MQTIEPELAEMFQEEQAKIKDFDISKLELTSENSEALDKFFKKFLDPKEEFPEGARHSVIEKNFAIYVIKNKCDLKEIGKAYTSKGYNLNSLISQMNGVQNGTYSEKPNVSVGELVNWCKEFRPDLANMFNDYVSTGSSEKLKEKPASDFNPVWDKDLKDYQERHIEWLVKRVIKSGSVGILGGKRACTKSWLAMDIGYSISTGKPFLNKFDCIKGNVLYLDRENGFSELKKRSLMVKKFQGIEEAQMVFLSENTLKLDAVLDLELLEEFIIENNIVLIIVDTYRRLISFKEDSADEVSRFFVDMLKPMCERTGVAVLLIHHEKKGEDSGDDLDMLRGSSDLANYVDSALQIKRKGDFITIKQTKQRAFKELEPFQVKINTDETSFFGYDYVGVPQTKEVQIAKVIVEWILENKIQKFRYTEALEYCKSKDFKESSIKSALRDMNNKGIVTKGNNPRDPYVVGSDLNLEVFN